MLTILHFSDSMLYFNKYVIYKENTCYRMHQMILSSSVESTHFHKKSFKLFIYQNVTFWWVELVMILIFCFVLLFLGDGSNVERHEHHDSLVQTFRKTR